MPNSAIRPVPNSQAIGVVPFTILRNGTISSISHLTISIQRSSDFRVFSRIPPAKTAPLSRFWVWSAAFINPPPEAAPLHPLPLTPPATSLVEVNAGPTSDTATHLENAITFNESAGIGESLSQGLQHWPVPIGDVPTHIYKIPNAAPGSDLVEAFPGVIPGVPFPYPLETVEHTDPENYNVTTTHPPIVTISFRGTGGLRLWAIRHKGNPALQENHQIFLSDATHQNDLIGLPSGPEVTYWIEPLTPGPITLTYRAKARHNPAELVKEFPINIVFLPIDIVPDWNRDGKIDSADRGRVSAEKPWRFWVNNDNDSNETDGNDIPNPAGGNGFDVHVNGLRDLNDFFPLWLDIGAALNAMPETEYDYVLESDTHALQFIETDLEVSNVKKFLTGELGSTSVMDNPNAIALHSTIKFVHQQQGKLSQTFLSKAKTGGKGVLLMEAFKPTQNALKLVIRKKSGGGSPAEFPMPLNIQSVEKMYRHLNLLGAAGGSGGRQNEMGEPANYPDELCNTKNFVFVHGYNVNPDQARGWAAETFKRLWWSGSKAKYVAVTWHGSESQVADSVTPDYHSNVENAFATAQAFKNALAVLPGEKMVAAHSLGNMLVGSALTDWNAPIDKYIAIDGAVAMESWDGGAAKSNDMVHLDWDNPQTQGTYPDRLWASEWHQLWPTGDARNKLTWRDRLGNLGEAQVYNFYSSGEEVLAAHPHDDPSSVMELIQSIGLIWPNVPGWPKVELIAGRNARAMQEKLKGRMHNDLVLGSHSGGWGFSSAYDTTKDAQGNPALPLTLPDPAQTSSAM